MKKDDLPKEVEYEDLSPEAKGLFDEARPLNRKERRKLKDEGHDLFTILTSGMNEDDFLDKILDMVYGDDQRLDDLLFYEERILMNEILTKSMYKVGMRERKN